MDDHPTFRVVLPDSTPARPGASYCQVASCNESTRENKPYCSDHVEQAPYVQRVLLELELRELEAANLNVNKPIDINGHLVREATLLLKQSSYTAARLARLLDIEHVAAENLIVFMDQKGMAHRGRTERGSTTIRAI